MHPDNRRLRVALVGLEHWYFAYGFIDALARIDAAQLVSISDHDLARARTAGGRIGVQRYCDDYLRAVRDPEVDLVIITTTTADHCQLTVEALRNGKHVFCNKPMAMTLNECERMNAEAARSAGKLLILNGAWRYWPMSRKAREIIASGELGEILNARFWTRAPLPREAPDTENPGWFIDPRKAAGGAFIDHGIYQFDLVEWLTGSSIREVERLSLYNLKYKDLPVDDFGNASVILQNGARVLIEEGWLSPVFSTGWEITGTKGEMIVDTASRPCMSLLTSPNGPRLYFDPDSRDNVQCSIEAYLGYLRGDVERPPTGVETARLMGMFLGK